MCRFLLVKSKNLIKPKNLLTQFAKMAKKSKAYDGDWQGDGWGISFVDSKNNWQCHKSLSPIWEDLNIFTAFPKTKTFVVHARSASFPNQKGNITFNQPFINGKYSFVFNGLLKGVRLPNIPGNIGAEKIWYLLKQELKENNLKEALKKTKELLLKNSKEIFALNIGLATPKKIYSLCFFTKYPKYYQLRSFKNQDIEIICSESLDWNRTDDQRIINEKVI